MSKTVPAAGTRRPSPPPALSGADVAMVWVLAGFGLAARVVVLRHGGLGALDSDEAVVGLMAQAFRHGHLRAMFWGQSYGGTIEQGLVAIVFSIAGVSTLALKVVPIALQALAAVLT